MLAAHPDLLLYAALALLVAVFAMVAAWWWGASKVARANARRGKRAQRGERVAERMLERAGYRVLDRQVHCTSTMSVDGEDVEIAVRVDLIVRRRRRRFVAEVKTGASAPSPTLPATRRQLREYAAFFPDHGLLLVDVEAARILEISF